MNRKATENKYEDIYHKAFRYIGKNYKSQRVELDQFCKDNSLSRRTVQRALKHMRVTWRQLVLQTRLGHACRMLLYAPNKNIQTIGKECGFANPSHFAKQFQKQMNMTPIEYRNDVLSP